LPSPTPADDAMSDESLCRLDALELSRALHRREASCREVMRAYLARIGRLNPRFNAIVSLRDEAQLLAEAGRCDEALARGESRGWMHGFPLAIKDLAPTRGVRTTFGSPLHRDFVPEADGLVVERIRAAGGIVIGKTNTPEWGLGSHTYNPVFGTTLNAYDPSRSCGGSSGGAAVALALRLSPVADGSDMGGSLRNPAGWNNVFGLRPSRGRVPMWPAEDAFFQQLGTEGPMARTVPDLAALLRTLAGPDPRAPLALDADPAAFDASLESDPGDWRGVRVGWLGDLGGHLATEPGVIALCETALRDVAGLGCEVEPTALGFDHERVWRAFMTLRAMGFSGRFAAVRADPQAWRQLKPEAQWEVVQGEGVSALDVYRASATRTAWYHHVLALLSRFDVLALPVAQCFPFDARLHWPSELGGRKMDSYHRWMEVVTGATMAGLPAISVPAGFDARGLPMGLQLVGRPNGELALLRLARAYELATRWVQRRPPPDSLTGDPE
jgi:amidase